MSKKHLTPHDKFFRSAMSNIKVAREFFEQNLPEDIKSIIDFSTIELQKESYVGDNLKLQVADILYSADFSGQKGYLYTLVEHQSRPERFMALRIIKYILAIMEDHLKKTKDRFLPVVYPCIYYTGARKYNYSTNLFDLFGKHKELVRNILLKPYQLIDLTTIPDADLKKGLLRYSILAQLMKHIRNSNFVLVFKELVGDLKAIEDNGEMDYIYAILSYAMYAKNINKQEFIEVVKTGLKISEDEVMTLAEQFRQEGYNECKMLAEQWKQESLAKGIEKGKLEALEQVALNLHGQGLTTNQIAAATSLTVQQVEALKNKNHN